MSYALSLSSPNQLSSAERREEWTKNLHPKKVKNKTKDKTRHNVRRMKLAWSSALICQCAWENWSLQATAKSSMKIPFMWTRWQISLPTIPDIFPHENMLFVWLADHQKSRTQAFLLPSHPMCLTSFAKNQAKSEKESYKWAELPED